MPRPLTKLADDGFLQLHCAHDNAVTWLRDVAMKTLANNNTNFEAQVKHMLQLSHFLQKLYFHFNHLKS